MVIFMELIQVKFPPFFLIYLMKKVERALSIFMVVLGAGFYSFTIGSISNLLVNLDTRD